jgi:choline dehydrogenase-like flavoprotein
MLIAGSFQPDFDPTEHLTCAHIAASRIGVGGVQLWEDLNNGVDSMFMIAAWQRNFVPASLRNNWFATASVGVLKFCDENLDDNPNPNTLCAPMEPLNNAGCNKNIVGIASLLGTPTSRGSVSVKGNGELRVDVNYLATDVDLEAFGATIRTTHEIMSSFTGPASLQRPCVDKKNQTCMSNSCPELIKDYVDYVHSAVKLATPSFASRIRRAPASMLYPQYVEPALANKNNDNLYMGKILKDDIFAAHHFAGSSSIGTVVDSANQFSVIGVDGLYVVDASMLPTTTRGNPMATVMALGRIAGLQAGKALL